MRDGNISYNGEFTIDIDFPESLSGDYTNVDLLPAGNENYSTALSNAVAIGGYGDGDLLKLFWGNDDMGNLPEAFDSFTATLQESNTLLIKATANEQIDQNIFLIFVVDGMESFREYVNIKTSGDLITFELQDIDR